MKLLLFLAIVAFCIANDGTLYSVDQRLGKYYVSEGKSPVALAWGYYKHEVTKDGWGKLYIWTSDTFKSHDYSIKTAYAAGYLEGSLTYQHIWDHFWSWFDYTFGKEEVTTELKNYLIEQYEYSRQLVADNKNNDEYYQALGRILAQNDGLFQAIQDFAPVNKRLTWVQLLLLQACGDIYELKEAMKPKTQRIKWSQLTPEVFEWEREQRISCSSLIKALDDWSDVWMAHTTWTSYQNMLRIYKYYQFSGPKPYRVSFSSKPGLLYSKDDFYVLPDANMVVIETTNSILDDTLYDLINPQTLLTWQRVPVSHSISNNGQKWTSTFVRHNSGTYNNQYIVIDLKVVQKGVPPTKDFIWISETIPGFYKINDVTAKVISNGNYWKSYNIPYDTEIYDKAGYTEALKKDPVKYSYEACPRSQIFNRDAPNVKTLDGMKKFIRYNDYKNDALSNGNPGNAISSRLDLLETNPRAHGSIDGKIASLSSVPLNRAYIQSGPTTDQQPVFSWIPAFNTGIHWGQPTTFNFNWIEINEEQVI